MISQAPPPEIQILSNPLGSAIIGLVGLLIFGVTLRWAWRPGSAERRVIFLAALFAGLALFVINLVAIGAGWWAGALDSVFTSSLLAICVLLGTGAWLLWLQGYRWLAARVRRPLLTYAGIVLLFIPVVLIVAPLQIRRGQFRFGGGYTIWTDVLLGQAVMGMPVFLYEGLRRRIRQNER